MKYTHKYVQKYMPTPMQREEEGLQFVLNSSWISFNSKLVKQRNLANVCIHIRSQEGILSS